MLGIEPIVEWEFRVQGTTISPVRDELVRQIFKGFTVPRSQEQCTHLPSLSHSVSHPGQNGGVSFSVGRVGRGAGGWNQKRHS